MMKKINLKLNKKYLYILLTIVLLLILVILGIVNKANIMNAFNKKSPPIAKVETKVEKKVETKVVPKRVTPVSVYITKLDNLELFERSVGVIYNLDSSKVSSETSGVVNKVYVEIGDKISKNQILAEIDKKELINSRDTQQFDIKRIQSQLLDQEKNLQRYKDLFKNGYVSQSELDGLQTSVNGLKQQVSIAKSILANYEISIAKSTIRSPIAGVLQERNISEGTLASIGTHLFTIVDNSNVLILVNYPEFFSDVIKTGQKALITLSDGNVLVSQIKDIKPIIEENTRSLQAIIAISNNSYKLKPGGTVNVSVVVENKLNVVLIPQDAIVLRSAGKVVYVLNADNETVQERLVKVGASSQGQTEILEGLDVDEKIVVIGAGFLTNGAKVKIQE